jgi:Homeodomain-like domain
LVDVAEAIEVDGRTLARWIQRLVKAGFQDPRQLGGVPTRPTGSAEQRALARQLALEGLPLPEIASRLGFDRRTVARWVAAP